MLHVVHLPILPTSPSPLPLQHQSPCRLLQPLLCKVRCILAGLSSLLISIPSGEALIIVGNFNVQLEARFSSLHPLCPEHGTYCVLLQGTVSRPSMAKGGKPTQLLSTHTDLHVISNCNYQLLYTHQAPASSCHTTAAYTPLHLSNPGYFIVNTTALQLH